MYLNLLILLGFIEFEALCNSLVKIGIKSPDNFQYINILKSVQTIFIQNNIDHKPDFLNILIFF